MIDMPFQVGITNATPFIENSSGVFPHLERRIYTNILSVAASAGILSFELHSSVHSVFGGNPLQCSI